ncbi:MAG: hypothetical protein AAF449_18255, partial [Myxococcota bacterium]
MRPAGESFELRVWTSNAVAPKVTIDGRPIAARVERFDREARSVFTAAADDRHVQVIDASGTFSFDLVTDDAGDEPLRIRAREALRSGDWPTAVTWYDRSRAHNERSGRLSRAARDGQAAAFALLHFGEDLLGARTRLQAARDSLAYDRQLWAMMPYYEGLIDRAGLHFTKAVERFREAQRRLKPLDKPFWRAGNEVALASSLQQLGRRDEAEPILKRLAAADLGSACANAQHLNNYAWVRLIDDDRARRVPDSSTVVALNTAAQLYETTCDSPKKRALVAQHRALAELLSDRPDAAEKVLGTEAPVDRAEERMWSLELKARIARRRGDLDAADRWVTEG